MQEAFNQAVAGLASQNFAQSKIGSHCKYRLRNLKCALGHLIPDELYLEMMDHRINGWTAREIGEHVPALYELPQAFLGDLQNAHDTAEARSEMKKGLRHVAKTWGLEIPEILE